MALFRGFIYGVLCRDVILQSLNTLSGRCNSVGLSVRMKELYTDAPQLQSRQFHAGCPAWSGLLQFVPQFHFNGLVVAETRGWQANFAGKRAQILPSEVNTIYFYLCL